MDLDIFTEEPSFYNRIGFCLHGFTPNQAFQNMILDSEGYMHLNASDPSRGP